MGLSPDGFEFLKGNFEGLKGYVVGRMTKSRRSKLYIDDEGWAPEAGLLEYRYRVPFGGIHVFIGKIGKLGPKPDICTDLVETAALCFFVTPDYARSLDLRRLLRAGTTKF